MDGACSKRKGKIMAYVIEVAKRDMSDRSEECGWKNEEGHNTEGTGPDCDEMCMSLDGNPREVRDYGTHTHEYDAADHAEDHGSPVGWAVALLGNMLPVAATFPDLHAPQQTDGRVSVRDWLHGTEDDPYRDQYTEYTVYLTGDWSDEERGHVFRTVGGR